MKHSNKIFQRGLFFLLTISFIVSCTVDDKLESPTETDLVIQEKAAGNILEFGSFQELETFISDRLTSHRDLLDESRNMASSMGYYSLLYLYNSNLAEIDSVGLRYEDIPIVNSYDDMLHLLLNQDGEIKIEDKTYRIDGEFVFQYTPTSERFIDQFLREYTEGTIQLDVNESVEYENDLLVFRHENDEIIEFVFDDERQTRGITINDNFSNCSTSHRMKSKQFDGFYLFYSSIGASTKIQKRKRFWFFGWHYYWSTVKRYNRLEYDVEYTGNSTLGYPPVTFTKKGHRYCHCNSASKTFDFAVGIPAPYNFSPNSGAGETVHWAHEFTCNPDTEHRTINY
ncbi:hypothetical protein [Luteirhabdus pelagi]|uniref:hypothetical protein n=1 Tax=Luteirhabdus pelagi TaxID=2792783 RepID=UPI00193997C5|nr:hypothetical protein [Luteirhabdus pelagi]